MIQVSGGDCIKKNCVRRVIVGQIAQPFAVHLATEELRVDGARLWMKRDGVGIGVHEINFLGAPIRTVPGHHFHLTEDIWTGGRLHVVYVGAGQPAIFELLELMRGCDVQAVEWRAAY